MYKTSKVVFSPRVRKSPYFNSTIKYGAQAFSVYNHMYMPISFEGTVEDYRVSGPHGWTVPSSEYDSFPGELKLMHQRSKYA